MDIMNQDQELITDVKSVYASKQYYLNKFMGWNVYGKTPEGLELLGTLDEEKEATQIVKEISKLMKKGIVYYEFPQLVESVEFDMVIEGLEGKFFVNQTNPTKRLFWSLYVASIVLAVIVIKFVL